MAGNIEYWKAFIQQVEATGRFPKAILTPPDYDGNVAYISGEVTSADAHNEIVEMARRKGFVLMAENLLVLSGSDQD